MEEAVALADFRTSVDLSWSERFGVEPDVLRTPGVHVVVDTPGFTDYWGLFLFRIYDACIIAVPGAFADRVRVGGRTPDELFTRAAAADLAGDMLDRVLGPSIHAYLDESMFRAQPPCDARRLHERDDQAIARFREDVDSGEWSEGGFGDPLPEVMWGGFMDGRLVAMGNMTDLSGHEAGNDVGVVTHPDVRGQGQASRLVGAMVADGLATMPFIRYRALESNLASRAVCRKIGFADHGANIGVRLR